MMENTVMYRHDFLESLKKPKDTDQNKKEINEKSTKILANFFKTLIGTPDEVTLSNSNYSNFYINSKNGFCKVKCKVPNLLETKRLRMVLRSKELDKHSRKIRLVTTCNSRPNSAKATVTRLTNKNELLEMEKNERKRTVHKPGKSHQRRHTINGSLSEKDRMVLYKNLKKNNNFIAFNVESIYTSEKKLVGHQSSPALILIDANRYIQKQHVRSMFEVGYREKNQKPNIHEKSTQPPEQEESNITRNSVNRKARKSTGLKIDIPTIGLITDQGDSLILQHRHDPLTRTKSPFGFTDSDLSNHKSQALKSELSFSNTKIPQISPLTQRKSHTNFSAESSTTNSNNLLANNLADYRPVSPNSLASASISNVEAGAFGLPSVLNDSNITSYHTLTKPMSVDSPDMRRSRGRSPSFTKQSTTSSFPCVIQEGAIISHQFETATTQHDFPPPKTHRSSSYMRFVTTDSFPTVKNENQSNSRPNVHTDHFLDLNQRLIKMINDDSNNATSFSPTVINNEEMVEWPTANSPMVKPNTEHNSKPLLSVKANDGIGIRSRANSNVRGSTVDNRSRATSISNDSIEGDNTDIKNHFYTRGRRNTKTESTKSSNDTLSGYPMKSKRIKNRPTIIARAADDPMIGERLTSIKLYEDLTKNSIKISKEKLVKAICGPRDYKKKLIDVHIQKEKVEEDKLIKHKMDQYRRKMFIEKERCETFKRSRSTKLLHVNTLVAGPKETSTNLKERFQNAFHTPDKHQQNNLTMVKPRINSWWTKEEYLKIRSDVLTKRNEGKSKSKHNERHYQNMFTSILHQSTKYKQKNLEKDQTPWIDRNSSSRPESRMSEKSASVFMNSDLFNHTVEVKGRRVNGEDQKQAYALDPLKHQSNLPFLMATFA